MARLQFVARLFRGDLDLRRHFAGDVPVEPTPGDDFKQLDVLGSAAGAGECATVQVFFHSPTHVHCDFVYDPSEETELLDKAARGELVVRMDDVLGGSGSATIYDDEGRGRVELLGSVRDLTPIFEKIAADFRARLAELPD